MSKIILISFLLISYITSFGQNVEIVHSDYLTIIPGERGGTKDNTYNYILKTQEEIHIDTIYINKNKICFTEDPLLVTDSMNINIKMLISNYSSKTEKESTVLKVECNGKPVNSKLEKIDSPRQVNSATCFILSNNKSRFCLNIKKFDKEIVLPMP